MEILQTIWNALISENERLTSFLVIPFAFIESLAYMLLFQQVLKINPTKKQQLMYVISYSTLSMISIYIIPSPYYTFVNLIIFVLSVFLIFKTTIFKSIIAIIIVYALTLFVGTPLTLIGMCLFNLSADAISAIPLYRVIYCVLFCAFLFFIAFLISKYHFKFNFINKIKYSRNLFFNFILGTIAIAIQCYIEFTYINYLPNYLVILSSFVLVLYFIISMISLYRTSKLEITTQNLEAEKLYNQSLTILYDKIRGYKHDFNNIVQGLGGYISTGNMEGLREYYNGILDDCQRTNNLSLLSPDVINNPAIYSLLTAKYHTATEFGIKMNLEIFMDLTTIKMKIYELTRLLGILIDNAIEAAKQCTEKEITITIRNDSNKKKQLFIIENTYANKDVNIDNIFEKGHTSKTTEDAKNHGIGLWEVRQFIKKHKNLDLYTTKSEKYFKQQFEIYY